MAHVLGREQNGLGYPSGHAAVSTALAAVAAPHVPARWRAPLWGGALLVGPARMYVGAHLPLDVAGGIAFGLAVACLPLTRQGPEVDRVGGPLGPGWRRDGAGGRARAVLLVAVRSGRRARRGYGGWR